MAVHQIIQLYKSDVFWVGLYQVVCSHGGSCIWLYTRLFNDKTIHPVTGEIIRRKVCKKCGGVSFFRGVEGGIIRPF